MRRALWVAVTLLLLGGLGAATAQASYPTAEQKVVAAIKKLRPSVVYIVCNKGTRVPSIGSGIIIKENGIILTSNHVVRKAKSIRVYLYNGRRYSATLVKASRPHDLAVIRIDATGLVPAKFADSSRLEQGQIAISLGAPMKFSFSASVGCVSALGRQQSADGIRFRELIQTDAAINPGSSGGPLANSDGEVIGVNALVYAGHPDYKDVKPQGIAFAIPSNLARQVADDLLSGGTGEVGLKPYLGVKGENVTADDADTYGYPTKSGVLVTEVNGESPAQSAGIKVKDIITKVNGKTVRTLAQLSNEIGALKVGQAVEIGLWRGGKFIILRATLESSSQ